MSERLSSSTGVNSLSNNEQPSNNHKSEEERRILNIVQDLKLSFEQKATKKVVPSSEDTQAAESLLLLGTEPPSTENDQTPLPDAVDALLNLHCGLPLAPSSNMAPPSSNSLMPRPETLGISGLQQQGALINGTNGWQNESNATDMSVTDLLSWLKDVPAGSDHNQQWPIKTPDNMPCSSLDDISKDAGSPTKVSQLLRSIWRGSPRRETLSTSLVHPSPIILPSAASKSVKCLHNKVDYPNRSSSVPIGQNHQIGPSTSKLCKSLDGISSANASQIITECNKPKETIGHPEPFPLEKVEFSGQLLNRVRSRDLDKNAEAHVFISDVFQCFFKKRHWDEFRSILERNGVAPTIVRPDGCDEAVETITLETLKNLLLNNLARKEGFVRCLQITPNSADNGTSCDTKIIAAQESLIGELSSGIRTRHQDHQDVAYVEVQGYTLPSLVVRDGSQWVRLVDLQQILYPNEVDLEKHQASHALLKRLKAACTRLGIPVERCSTNQKARLVVHAHSFRSSSLHVISVTDLNLLIGNERKRLESEEAKHQLEKLKRSLSSTTLGKGICVIIDTG